MAVAKGLVGVLTVLDGGTATVGSGWAPTPIYGTTLSQLNVPVGPKTVEIQVTATGDAQIDDVYVDPFLSR